MFSIVKQHWKKFILLAIIGLIVYGNSLFNGFVWDDEEQLVNNNAVHSLKNIPMLLTGSTFNSAGAAKLGGLYYKPLMSMFFAVMYTLFGSSPFPFHLIQVLIHIVNAILVFAVFAYFLKDRGYTVPVLLATIFLIHPINTEAVVYVSALQDVLFFCFGMLALSITLWSAPRSPTWRFWLVGFLLLLSLLSKETGVVFLVLVFVSLQLTQKRQKLLTTSLPIVSAFITYLVLRVGLAGIALQRAALMPIMRATLTERLLTMPKIIMFYLQTSIFPHNLAISQHWLVTRVDWVQFYLPLLISLTTLGMMLGIWRYIRKISPRQGWYFGFFFGWFWLSLGMHLQIIPLDMTVAERWFYLPLVGWLGMAGVFVSNSTFFRSVRYPIKTILTVFLLLILILLAGRTFVRNLNWRDGLTLFSHDITISKNAFDLENNLGVELFRVGSIAEAKPHFAASTKLAPYWWTNWNNLGAVYEQEGDLTTAAGYYKRSIENGDYYLAYENYAMILVKLQKFPEAQTFLEKEALPRFPDNPKLAEIYNYLLNRTAHQ